MVTSKILSFLDFSENQAIQTLVTKKWNLLRKSSIDEIFFLRFSEEQSICQHFFRSCHNFCQINFQKASLLLYQSQKVSKYFQNKNWISEKFTVNRFWPKVSQMKAYLGIQVPNGCSSEKALKLKLDQTHFWTIENFANKRCILAKLWSKVSLKPVTWKFDEFWGNFLKPEKLEIENF